MLFKNVQKEKKLTITPRRSFRHQKVHLKEINSGFITMMMCHAKAHATEMLSADMFPISIVRANALKM